MQAAFAIGRDQLPGALQVHHVHVVFVHVLFQRRGQLRALGIRHRDEVLDGHGVEHLAAETLSGHAGADAFACCIDGGRGAGRATAHHQHIERRLGTDLLGSAPGGVAVQACSYLLDRHAAGVENLAVEVHGGHRHDLACVHFVLEQRAINRHMLDVGIEHAHQVQCLHSVRATVAGERHEGLEAEVAIKAAHLLDHVVSDLGRVATHLQQGQHQRGELMAHGNAGKAHGDVRAQAVDRKGGLARILAVQAQRNLVGQRSDVLQQGLELLRLLALVEGRHQFDRVNDLFEVGLQLRLQIGIQHERLHWFLQGERHRHTDKPHGEDTRDSGNGPGRVPGPRRLDAAIRGAALKRTALSGSGSPCLPKRDDDPGHA